MASKSPSVFNTSDRNLTRLRKMCEVVSTKAFRQLLRWLNPKWMPTMSFKEYLKTEKKVSMKAFNNILKPHQKAAVRTDPQGDNHDISLLYILLLWGNEGLADKDDEVWKKKSGRLEYIITSVKDVRNDLMHRYVPIDVKEFHEKTEALRNLLKDMINSAITTCKHITQAEVDRTLQDMNDLINKIRDDPLEPKDFEDYKRQLMFPQQCDFVRKKGARALRKRHSKYSSLTPVSRLAKVNFPVDNVFTEMLLERGSGKEENLELQDLLDDGNQSVTDDVMLVEGEAGVGKTTLTKKLLIEWTRKKGKIKHLGSYDLVIHAECRDHIGSFKGLLESSMPEVSQSFQGDDMAYVTLGLKILVIIDGLDELNKTSIKLFKEILQLRKDYGISVLVTCRPEAVEKYFNITSSHQIGTKHIRLLGIPLEKREDFVKKYYKGIVKTGLSNLKDLLKYLKRTEHRLSHLWKLPYNLTIVTILWTMMPDVVNLITTAPELNWEIHKLSLSKLKDRLLDNESTQHLSNSVLVTKINHFIYSLCRESLIALANDDITLPQVAYERLESICIELEIPVEEMTGAFLKKTVTVSGTRYGYPHKGLQDFLAALFIWIRLTATPMSTDILEIIKVVDDALTKNAVPLYVCRNIVKFAAGELRKANNQSSTQKHQSFDAEKVEELIESLLETNLVPEDMSQDIIRFAKERFNQNPQVTESSSVGTPIMDRAISRIIQEVIGEYGLLNDTAKFQNMFISLIGMFYLDSSSPIENDTKMEALWLLQQTGVRDKDAWLNILNSVKCDEYVASFISKQPSILEGAILICDSNLFAYISLIQALKPPLDDASEISINVDMKGDLAGVSELIKLLSIHHFKEKKIHINDGNFMEYTILLQSLQIFLKNPTDIGIEVLIDENLTSINQLLKLIRKNNFTITMLQVKDLRIHDSNIDDCISTLRCLPQFSVEANKVSVDIDIERDLKVGNELLKLLTTFQFRVKRILINEYNFIEYITLLKSLNTPIKDAHGVEVVLRIDEDLSTINEILQEIKRNNFTVKLLCIKEKDILVDHSNVTEYIAKLKSLPTLLENAFDGIIDLYIKEETPEISELLEELTRNKFRVKVNNLHAFQFPTIEETLKNVFDKIFESCVVERYIGAVVPFMYLPGTIKELIVSVANSSCYNSLCSFFSSSPSLEVLHLCIPCNISPLDIMEVPVLGNALHDFCLYLPDLSSEEDITNAVEIMKRLGLLTRNFNNIYFPRARLNTCRIEKLLKQMKVKGVKIEQQLVFSCSCKPKSHEEINRLRKIDERTISCTYDINWNEVVDMDKPWTDLDDWEQ